jgi:hypothetical protein
MTATPERCNAVTVQDAPLNISRSQYVQIAIALSLASRIGSNSGESGLP